MGKQNKKKLTIEDVLIKAEVGGKEPVYYTSKVLGGDIEIRKASLWEVTQIIDKAGEAPGAYDGLEMSCKMILKHCPIFRSEELQDKCNVGEPFEVVPVVLQQNMGEIGELVETILKMYNLDSTESMVENVKN